MILLNHISRAALCVPITEGSAISVAANRITEGVLFDVIGQAPAHHFFLTTSDMTSDSNTYSEHTQFQIAKQNTQKIQSDLLTRKEAAAYLGVTSETLVVWHCTKRYPLAVVKIGRLAKFRKSDLDAFIKSRTV
jgi:excisionase family DNA binding protein